MITNKSYIFLAVERACPVNIIYNIKVEIDKVI